MEIVFTDDDYSKLSKNKIHGLYGDVLDLVRQGIIIEGLIYDDEWTVKRLLNGFRFKLSSRVYDILKYLEFEEDILNKRIKYLSKTELKFVLLAKVLLLNKKTIIFDYFDVGLSHKDKKRIIRIMRNMSRDGIGIIIISKDLVFLDKIVNEIEVVKNNEVIYNGEMQELISSDLVDDPDIIKFIKMANKKGAKLEYTLDSRELLKDIYRSVC